MISYKNIHKAFDIPVLTGVDLTVETGEMFALFGPSGTGKSVLMKTTLSLVVPDLGDVEVDGLSVYEGPSSNLEEINNKKEPIGSRENRMLSFWPVPSFV